ncbi:MAG: GTPase ObgE [Gemmatimonadales bacterium]|nr:MAG: GTPase ObgE [Gemmatimonadales bacterium]
MFVDQVRIRVVGGTGGSGSDAFRRESFVPRGGPAGGDGGHGGSVILKVDTQLSTLRDFRYHAEVRAGRGQHGQGKNRTGARGEDRVLRVPPGTQVRDQESGEVLGELLEEGEELVVARGGRGGRGNVRFTTATNQAPRTWEPGDEGEERSIELTLKLMADVGLVGEPNAGKSTLLSVLSGADPRVADYPFTTLEPHLGVVSLPGYRSFVLADIPGIIEGAHEGRGLGHQFLRHIERTRILALMVPLDGEDDPGDVHARLQHELEAYSPELAARPHVVVLTKVDLEPDLEPGPVVPPPDWAPEARGVFRISAATRAGLAHLLEGIWETLVDSPAEGPEVGTEGRGSAHRGSEGHEEAVDLDDEDEWWGGEPL